MDTHQEITRTSSNSDRHPASAADVIDIVRATPVPFHIHENIARGSRRSHEVFTGNATPVV
jgi:hypothetical protein